MAKKKTRNKKERRSALYYAMPWNLRKEINSLGYEFSAKKICMVYIAILLIMGLFGYALKLPFVWIIPLFIAGLLFAPAMIRNAYKNKWEKKRFSDVNVYIEQMLYAFKQSQRVLTTLQDVRILFKEGSAMREVIDEAIEIIANPSKTATSDSAQARALAVIEARYPNEYVKSLHRFMLKVESIGGNFDSSISLMLENRAMWENRVYKLQDKRKQKKYQILGSCIASILLCMVMLYILPEEVDISAMLPVRITNVIMVIVYFRVYLTADNKLSSNLLQNRKEMEDDKLIKDYERFVTYDSKKELKKSLMYSVIPLLIIVVGQLVFHNIWAVGVGGVLLPLFLCQHMIGHSLLEKRLRREIAVAFPQWLMELALLLQTDNVQVAIFKTIDNALPVLQPELIKLRDGLTATPDSAEPFLNFFSLFEMPEVTTSMQMLYSLSTGSGGDADEQISNIVKRNNIILDRAEEIANENSMAGLYTLFILPVMLGAIVLMVDMTCFLVTFMSKMMI